MTPSQHVLFSENPIVGSRWEKFKSQGLFKDQRPDDNISIISLL